MDFARGCYVAFLFEAEGLVLTCLYAHLFW
jgi:hypothetical protein